MATQVQLRRGTTAETGSFTGAVGETTVDTTKNTLVVHDNSQIGGYPLMREDGNNSGLSSGSLGSCALKFANSYNTGIYSPSPGSVGLVSNGIAGLTIGLTGNATFSGNLTVNGDRIRIVTSKTPASATATGTAGEVCWDSGFIYVCVAANTWKRASISTW
jgi:hypothetical protein